MATKFDSISFVIGLLLGAIIVLLLIWIAYFTRSFIFTYCASGPSPCAGNDYYSDPGDALINNPQIRSQDILSLNDQNQMFYKRVTKISNCAPESNQVIYMKYPQYCRFSDNSTTNLYRETTFNSNVYEPVNTIGPTIMTEGDCIPTSTYTSGTPIIQWDSNPIF